MAKLFIPVCGDRITLIQPWKFKLYLERRNTKFGEALGLVNLKQYYSVASWNRNNKDYVMATLETNTVLECDRVYIRANSKRAETLEDSYDSITWKVIIEGKAAKSQRFWVKLIDCESLEFDPNSISRYQDRK